MAMGEGLHDHGISYEHRLGGPNSSSLLSSTNGGVMASVSHRVHPHQVMQGTLSAQYSSMCSINVRFY